MSDLLFTIVIACFNQERFIGEAVDSALSQTHASKEVIVVDDASSDATTEVLRKFGSSITLVRLLTNSGVAAARNRGASLAKGRYLVFLDGDDVLMPWALEVYSSIIVNRYPIVMFGRSAKCLGVVPTQTTRDPQSNIHFVQYNTFFSKDRPCIFNTSTLVVERNMFWSVGGWSNGIFYQDIQDLMTSLGAAGTMILLLSPVTVWYRMHSTNASNKIVAFIDGIYLLLAKARTGLYPRARGRWLQQSAWFGGLIFYWTKTALRARLYRPAFELLAKGWWMIILAALRRSLSWLLGRRPVQVLPFREPATRL